MSLATCAGAEDPRAPDCLDRRIEMRAVETLKPCKSNARVHSRKQIRQIADSIQRFGFINPILVDENGEVVAGHGRLEAAKRLGLDQVPTLRITHLSAAERKAFALADNRLAELSGWDREILAIELQGLIDLDFDIALTGFEIDDLEIVGNDVEKPRRNNKARKGDRDPLASGLPVCRAGDVWLLGPHQLRCGNTINKSSNLINKSSNLSVDAALRAWQSAAGKPAVHFQTGKTLAEVAKQRAESNDAIRKSRAATQEAA